MSMEKRWALSGEFMNKCILLLTILLVFVAGTFGQNKFGKLTFELSALKTTVLLLEPIPFKLTVTNNTDAPVTVHHGLSFSTGTVSLEIRPPNGKTVTPAQLSYLQGRTFSIPKELASAESVEANEVFEFKLQNYFGKPGEYQVRATFHDKVGKSIRSGWTPLTVKAPTGMDLDAFEYISKKSERNPGNGMPFTSWKTDELEEFVMLHPRTTYANFARYGLGLLYESWRENDKAEAHFRQIEDSTFVHALDVKERLKKLEQQKNKTN
jgi:hypothetical protein